MEEKWDAAEEASWEAGHPYKDRKGRAGWVLGTCLRACILFAAQALPPMPVHCWSRVPVHMMGPQTLDRLSVGQTKDVQRTRCKLGGHRRGNWVKPKPVRQGIAEIAIGRIRDLIERREWVWPEPVP